MEHFGRGVRLTGAAYPTREPLDENFRLPTPSRALTPWEVRGGGGSKGEE